MIQLQRPRRLRSSQALRDMVQETHLRTSDLIAPLFVHNEGPKNQEIPSMPGIVRWSRDGIIEHVKELDELGIRCVCIFPKIDDRLKDSRASHALSSDCFYYQVLRDIKHAAPSVMVMTDIALDPYSSDGHDGIVDAKSGEIKNDETLDVLREMAILQAKAGADILGPSDMMDGRIGVIRRALEEIGQINTSIMSYTAKYASSFYGPFRDALDSAPRGGDKLSYQMHPGNYSDALREADFDSAEGADILMVKPALSYLDIIHRLKQHSQLPIAAYNVSGEYALVQSASELGRVDGDRVMMEILLSIKRAGADTILTYHAHKAAEQLQKV